MARGGSDTMDDQLDVPLEDSELLAEVELTTNLMIAASETEAVLPQAQVDEILGLEADGDTSYDSAHDLASQPRDHDGT